MSLFADQMSIRFLQDSFITDLFEELGLLTLFNTIYSVENLDVREIELGSILNKRFQVPAFETIRTTGVDERLTSLPERIKVDRAQPRRGRLAWTEIFLELLLNVKVHSTASPIESITTKSLLDQLGPVNTIPQLRAALAARFSPDVVNAFFKKTRITTIEDFKRRGDIFLEFVFKQPAPFDPADPTNDRTFRANVCVQFQAEPKIAEALQSAKLCRSILEGEASSSEVLDEVEVKTPFAFLVMFPDASVGDDFIPGLTAAQVKTNIKNIFASENMIAHFFA
ncbi:MAG TPA: hypothetical protein VJU84_11280 [Pyrinomonadaceae bacterium]|nr:hypothetical protein [Pyrinomonadaceae bacterium]